MSDESYTHVSVHGIRAGNVQVSEHVWRGLALVDKEHHRVISDDHIREKHGIKLNIGT